MDRKAIVFGNYLALFTLILNPFVRKDKYEKVHILINKRKGG